LQSKSVLSDGLLADYLRIPEPLNLRAVIAIRAATFRDEASVIGTQHREAYPVRLRSANLYSWVTPATLNSKLMLEKHTLNAHADDPDMIVIDLYTVTYFKRSMNSVLLYSPPTFPHLPPKPYHNASIPSTNVSHTVMSSHRQSLPCWLSHASSHYVLDQPQPYSHQLKAANDLRKVTPTNLENRDPGE
jgi:hypothetical protein